METEIEISEDAVLGGRLRLRQPLRGHRFGHDAILLAAATGARGGEHAVDLGAGVGAAGLALAARVPDLRVSLLEIDRRLSELAASNARLNHLDGRVRAYAVDVEIVASLTAAGFAAGTIDRVLMNPPFHDARRQNVSPDPGRRLAHVGEPGLLRRWIATAAWLLKSEGVLTLIWPADGLDKVTGELRPAFGALGVQSVLPRPTAPAIRVLARAVKFGRGTQMDYAPLSLNDEHGEPTEAAEDVLRGGNTLTIAQV
ncbi:MAG TPA: methyltransferase [Pseudolabrys sp.]|jgi:tRNA1(Val) A37 N6-methylase TrmN6